MYRAVHGRTRNVVGSIIRGIYGHHGRSLWRRVDVERRGYVVQLRSGVWRRREHIIGQRGGHHHQLPIGVQACAQGAVDEGYVDALRPNGQSRTTLPGGCVYS